MHLDIDCLTNTVYEKSVNTANTAAKPNPGALNPRLATFDPVACASRSHRDSKRTPLSQIIVMQEQLYAEVTNPKVKGHIKAACARAWEDLEERRRILLNRPLPGSLKPEPRQRKVKSIRAEPSDCVVSEPSVNDNVTTSQA